MVRPLLSIFVFLSSFLIPVQFQADLINEVAQNFKTGNSNEIAKSFNTSVELGISDESDVYSKAQAQQILRDFFSKHVPLSSSVIHVINTNPNYQIGILGLSTKAGKFRVTATFKKTSGSFFMTELRIDPEK
jgi:hypothetical protein